MNNHNPKVHTNAEMSHQNTISFKAKLFLDSMKTHGLKPTANKIYQRIYYKIKGVDFATQNLHDLTLVGDYQSHGTALVSTSKDFFQKVFFELESLLQKEIRRDVFLDYGSGKGAVLIHAKSLGFRKIYGIEFAKELHDISVKNIKKLMIYFFIEVTSVFKT